jgi:hypothetical protein
MHLPLTGSLIVLQVFQVLFLALHDWVQIGRLNDVAAVQAADPPGKLLATTVYSTLPFALGLIASLLSSGAEFPAWLMYYLWISYAMLFVGQLRAWWIPYLLRDEPARAERYQAMFGRTASFLPARHGITPNTLHIILHAATLATLIVLGARSV